MAKPTYYPDWATVTTTLPATGKANKVRPKETIRNIGWDKGQIPTAEEFNWQMNNYGLWIHYLVDELLPTLPNTYLPLTGTKVTLTGDLTGTIFWNGNKEVTSNIQVVDNSHNHLSGDITDATSEPTPNTIVKRAANGGTTIGRAVYVKANDGLNSDYFLTNSTGVINGSVNYSQTLGNINIYYSGGTGSPLSNVTLYNGFVNITNPRTANPQEGQGNSLVRFDYLGSQIAGVNTSINNVNNSLQNYINNAANTFISDVRLGSTYTKLINKNVAVLADAGGVLMGYFFEGDNPQGDTLYMKPIQKCINGNWYTVGQL